MENGNYAVSFLDTPNHTVYSNPMGVMMRGRLFKPYGCDDERSKLWWFNDSRRNQRET